ncbi:LptA/OstA family protein [Acetonema longum]|uniref:Organic solvent tolerance-like N-terminal domain-containing protein n=1 Tax=Acetonema longum DSM 6540 TaxID=1009370 RepID=F7NII2_9FIRM|nr:LptA/OstA family protein [Acetonema longum]EGO64128.1 hypothetical protein ALO_09424 [Acetonema longum DSM 6540]
MPNAAIILQWFMIGLIPILCAGGVHPFFSVASAESLKSERLHYDQQSNRFTASGNIRYSDQDGSFSSDTLEYDEQSGRMIAKGSVTAVISNMNERNQTCELQADSMEYDKNTGVYIFYDFTLQYEGDTYKGDKLEYNLKTKKFQMSGRVRHYLKTGEILSADTLVYDAEREVSDAQKYSFLFTLDEVTYRLSGSKLTCMSNTYHTEDASVTVCDQDPPHFRYTAKTADYYPSSRKLRLTKAAYWEGQHKIIELEAVTLPLYDKVTAGYDDDEGWYLKTQNRYDMNRRDYGLSYRDYMSRRGLGFGAREYRKGEKSQNELYWYASGTPGRDNQIFRGEWQLSHVDSSQRISFERRENGWFGKADLWEASASYLASDDFRTTNFNTTYFFQDNQLAPYSVVNSSLSQSLRLDQNLTGHAMVNWRREEQFSAENTKNGYNLMLDYRRDWLSAQLSASDSLDELREVPKLSLRTISDSPFQYALATSQVSWRDRPRVQQTDMEVSYRSLPVKLSDQIFFLHTANATETVFSDDNRMTNTRHSANFLINLNRQIYFTTGVTRESAKGYNSVYQTRLYRDVEKATWDMNYVFDEDYRFKIEGEHNFSEDTAAVTALTLEGRTFPFWNWSVSAAYDTYLEEWNQYHAYLTFNPDSALTGYIQMKYETQRQAVTEASVNLEGVLSDIWSYGVKVERMSNVSVVSGIWLTRKYHCRDLILSFYPEEKLYFAELIFKNP